MMSQLQHPRAAPPVSFAQIAPPGFGAIYLVHPHPLTRQDPIELFVFSTV